MPKTIALIVAAGSGLRLGSPTPKQFLPLAGMPMLRHALLLFTSHPAIDATCVVINPSYRAFYEASAAGLDLLTPVSGGASRQESVRNGLESLAAYAPDLVLIHDAARPFIDRDIVDRIIDALATADGALSAVPLVDTLKRAVPDSKGRALSQKTIDRTALWRAQTPQGFHYGKILAAHRAAAKSGDEMTDDAAVAEAAGLTVALVQGREENFKVTTEADMERATRMRAQAMEYRTGNGYDVHRLIPGDKVTLCGIEIPHDHRLEGHSDADVALHALTDAILGTISAEDIGAHFPPSDPQWRGAPSWRFLEHAAGLVKKKGGKIVHCDLTIICERPKIGTYRGAMTQRIAEIVGIDPDRVSVKATTTERLGFTGRSEGIAAQATATIALPIQP